MDYPTEEDMDSLAQRLRVAENPLSHSPFHHYDTLHSIDCG